MANSKRYRKKLLSDSIKNLLLIMDEIKVLLTSVKGGMNQVRELLNDENRED
jgi:hypothetical protein